MPDEEAPIATSQEEIDDGIAKCEAQSADFYAKADEIEPKSETDAAIWRAAALMTQTFADELKKITYKEPSE